MKNVIVENIFRNKTGSKYDVAVMYSGGKDSAFLLYLLKEVYCLRVLAVIVDNGFENTYMWEPMRQFTEKIGVPLEIITPKKKIFKTLFNTLIIEQQYFKKNGVNHVCFICNNMLWCSVAKYAAENDIPYVASGLSVSQLNSGRKYPLEANAMANSIAEKSTKMVMKNAIDAFKETRGYAEDKQFQEFIDDINQATKQVTTVYPYIYHDLNVDYMKNTLVKLGWKPPKTIELDRYISSGCKIMGSIVCELEKLGMVTLNEREQAKAMVKKGLLDEKELEYANYDASKDLVDLSNPLMVELGIKDFLTEECRRQNRKVIL